MNTTLFTLLSLLTCFAASLDVVKSGEYAIVNCGPYAQNVVKMLETLWGAIVQATQDAESDNPSAAYLTFFKDPENKAFISNILAQSSAGAAIHPPTPVNNGAPVFICVTAADQLAGTMATTGQKLDAYEHCQSGPISASSMSGTPYITICPYFWDSTLGTDYALTAPNSCLTVNSNNRFTEDHLGHAGRPLSQWGMMVLLEEIVHIYLIPEKLRRGITAPIEYYDANHAFALSADRSLLNAASYVLYTASIYGQCTAFPSQAWYQPPRRRPLAAVTTEPLPPGPTSTSDPADTIEGVVDVVMFPAGGINT